MSRLLPALSLALLPSFVAADDHADSHSHTSLGAHEHGVAELNVVLDGTTLEIELHSPAMNLLGFEHPPTSEDDHRRIAVARQQLEQADTLFGLTAAADCRLGSSHLESPLFNQHAHDEHHSDIQAHYHYTCDTPDALSRLDLVGLFRAFPGTEKIQLRFIGPNGQNGANLRPGQTAFTF